MTGGDNVSHSYTPWNIILTLTRTHSLEELCLMQSDAIKGGNTHLAATYGEAIDVHIRRRGGWEQLLTTT